MEHHDIQYSNLLSNILENGNKKEDRTGTGTQSVFGTRMEFDLTNYKIPLLTTKKVFYKGIIHELIWMLSGDTNIRYLKENGVDVWDSWIDPKTAEYGQLTLDEVKEEYRNYIKSSKSLDVIFEEDHIAAPKLPTLKHCNYYLAGVEHVSFSDRLSDDERIRILSILTGSSIPNVKLIGGELNKIYQNQWRGWEDIRIVENEDYKSIIAKDSNYNLVGHLQGEGNSMVVIRRKIDQIANLIEQLKTNPDSRRLIISTWNVANVNEMSLLPCHLIAQFYTRELSITERTNIFLKTKGTMDLFNIDKDIDPVKQLTKILNDASIPKRALSCQIYLRSADLPLALYSNVVQYTLLTCMVAQCVNMVTERFICVSGDTYIYHGSKELIEIQLEKSNFNEYVTVKLNPEIKNILDFKFEDIQI